MLMLRRASLFAKLCFVRYGHVVFLKENSYLCLRLNQKVKSVNYE